jgi:hypothetical protein
MNKKVYQLVEHTETAFKWYGIHEAIITKNKELYWVGSQAIRKFDSYHEAVEFWSKVEKNSSYLDILDSSEAEQYYDKLEYTDEEELNFDD